MFVLDRGEEALLILVQVRGHMHNPVGWQEWKPEALELARKHNRLIFLSVGYAACHCTFRNGL
jgi:hypothetical protein